MCPRCVLKARLDGRGRREAVTVGLAPHRGARVREASGGAGQVRALLAQQCVQLEDVPAHTARGHGARCGRRWPCLLLLLLAVEVVVWWR